MTIPLHSRQTAKPCQFRTPPRSSSPRCSLALVSNFSHSPLCVFRDLRTLSFSGSQLSRVLPASCALFRKKPGVHPCVVIPRLFTVDCRLSAVGQFRAISSISFVSPSCERHPRMSLVSPTYAKTGGCTPTQKCRRADIFDFSPDISHFLTSVPQHHLPERKKSWPRRSIRGAKDAHESQRYMEAGRVTSHLSSTCPERSATGPHSPSSAILWSGLQLGPSRLGRAANSIERFSYREYFCWK